MIKKEQRKLSQFSKNCVVLLGDPARISLEALASEMRKHSQKNTISGPLLHQWMTVTGRPRDGGLEALYKAVTKWRPLVSSVPYPEFRDDLLAASEEAIYQKYRALPVLVAREPKKRQAARAKDARIQVSTLCGTWLSMWTFEPHKGQLGYQVEVLNLGLHDDQDDWLHTESFCPRASVGRPYIQRVQLQLGDNAQNVVGVWHDLNAVQSGSVAFYLEPNLDVMRGKHLGIASDNSVRVGDWSMVRFTGADFFNKRWASGFRRQWMKLSVARIKRVIEEACATHLAVTTLGTSASPAARKPRYPSE